MNRLWLWGLPAAILFCVAIPASAQTVIGAKSGVINWVEGNVFLNDQPYVMQPSQFGEVKEKMALRTEAGRAEVLLPPGVFFRVAENTSFKMISNRLVDTRVELLTGSGIVEIDDLAKEANVTVVSKDATITLNKAGLYRFDSEPAQVKVFKGTAEVALHGDSVSVPAGKMMTLTGAVASVEKFNAEDTDGFDHWSRRRGALLADANISAAKQANTGYSSPGYSSPGSGGGILYGGINPCYGPGYGGGYGGYGPFAQPWGTWGYNPYYGFGTYVPCQGSFMSPYGFAFWSPLMAYRAFYSPNPLYTFNNGGSGVTRVGGVLGGYTAPGRRGFAGATPAPSAGGFSGNSGAVSRGSGGNGGGAGSSVGGVTGHGGGGMAGGGGGMAGGGGGGRH
jgi:hypothetical protein